MENKIPTTEAFLNTKNLVLSKDIYSGYYMPYSQLQALLIEFAKLHVESALKEAVKKVELKASLQTVRASSTNTCRLMNVDIDSILNAYPIDLIK